MPCGVFHDYRQCFLKYPGIEAYQMAKLTRKNKIKKKNINNSEQIGNTTLGLSSL